MSTTLYAITLASGYVYLQALINIAKQHADKGFNDQAFEEAIRNVIQDKAAITKFIDSAKIHFKSNEKRLTDGEPKEE